MDVTTTITDYLGYSNTPEGSWNTRYGKSFIVKSESGYYFPCRYAYITSSDFWNELRFLKGLKYKNGQCSYTQINILTEEPNFDNAILLQYEIPSQPFQPWHSADVK